MADNTVWLPKPGFDIHKGSGSMHIVFDLSSRYTNQPPNRINAFGPMPHWAKRCRQRTAWWLHHNRHCRPGNQRCANQCKKTAVRQNRKRFRCYFQHAKTKIDKGSKAAILLLHWYSQRPLKDHPWGRNHRGKGWKEAISDGWTSEGINEVLKKKGPILWGSMFPICSNTTALITVSNHPSDLETASCNPAHSSPSPYHCLNTLPCLLNFNWPCAISSDFNCSWGPHIQAPLGKPQAVDSTHISTWQPLPRNAISRITKYHGITSLPQRNVTNICKFLITGPNHQTFTTFLKSWERYE